MKNMSRRVSGAVSAQALSGDAGTAFRCTGTAVERTDAASENPEASSERTLYVSDLDGTLLDADSRLPAATAERLNRLIELGLPFTIATARSWSSASAILKDLRLTLPVVTYNGAFLVDPLNGRILESDTLSVEQVGHARQVFESHGASVLVYAFLDGRERVSWLAARENDGTRYYIDMRRGDPRLRRVDSEAELYAGDIFYLTAIGTADELEPLLGRFPESLGFSMTWQQELYREEYWLEVKRHDATKAHGVEKLKARTGLNRIVCFGDGVNDLPMFRIADWALAVENGNPALLAEADALIAPSAQGGVVEWLERNWEKAWKAE